MIPEWLSRRAELTPEAPALYFDDSVWSFAELDSIASGLARYLRARLRAEEGTRPRIGVLMQNSVALVLWMHAVPKADAILVPLNTRLTPTELSWQLDDVGATTLIYHEETSAITPEIMAQLPNLELVDGSYTRSPEGVGYTFPGLEGQGLDTPDRAQNSSTLPRRIGLDEIHSIIYTSGTTGRPKGATLTYGNHWWSANASVLNLGLLPDDHWLASMPLFHVGGLAILIRCTIYGIPVTLHERFDPARVDYELSHGPITIVSLVPTMLERTLDAHESRGAIGFPPSLRAILLGGGPAPEALLHRASRLHAPVLQTYGLTEAASQVTTLSPDDALHKIGSAGRPLFPTSIEIRGLDEEREGSNPLPPNEIGEILVSGPTITLGYWGRPEETDTTIRDGWLHTGDLGYLDEEGYLYVVDRRSDLFISGGENVYPAEIEEVLRLHPAVKDAGVIGILDEEWGRVPLAFICTDRTDDSELRAELRAHCEKHLARYKVPREFLFTAELPRNAAGKLSRSQLAAAIRT